MLGVRRFVVVDWTELSLADTARTFHRPEPCAVFSAQGAVGIAGIAHRFLSVGRGGVKRNPPRQKAARESKKNPGSAGRSVLVKPCVRLSRVPGLGPGLPYAGASGIYSGVSSSRTPF